MPQAGCAAGSEGANAQLPMLHIGALCAASRLPEIAMLELTLKDMSCGHCVAAVTRTLQQLDPKAQVSVDLPNKMVKVETEVEAERVKQALAEEGYPAS
jgi:copper chaperone